MFAELKDPVREKIERYGLTDVIEARHFFPTVGTAVEAFLLPRLESLDEPTILALPGETSRD